MNIFPPATASEKSARRYAVGVGLAAVAALAALGWIVVGNALATRRAANLAADWQRHTIQVQLDNERLLTAVLATESALRGYLLTNLDVYRQEYREQRLGAETAMAVLRADTLDNARQQENISALEQALAARFAQNDIVLETVRAQGRGALQHFIRQGEGQRLKAAVQARIDAIDVEEQRLLAMRRSEAARAAARERGAFWMALGFALVLLAIAAAAANAAVNATLRARENARRSAMAEQVQAHLEQRVAETVRELRKSETLLRQSQKMEAVGQLAGGIAHDFNNMLAIIMGSLDMARRRLEAGEPGVERYIENAKEGASRAAALTQRILAFSRLAPLEPAVLDINRLVADMSELLRRTLGETVHLETVCAGGLWTSKVDPNQLENALLNLAVNARDAMAEGGKLTIETANGYLDDAYVAANPDAAAGQYVVVAVSDTGHGMAPDVVERAFDPFFTTKGAGKGTGLGLSQVFGFVKQSGGHVKIYSEPGSGTTVKIYLPRWFGDEPGGARAAPGGAGLARGRAEETVLVVEDEERVRTLSVEALRELGYSVLHAAGGAAALEMLAATPGVALLFTDVVMADMNGRQLAEAATQKCPGLKVLFTTGYTRNAVVHNGVLDPGVAFITKPFTIAQLAAKVRSVLDGA
jgi:signal transduction histidine kinase